MSELIEKISFELLWSKDFAVLARKFKVQKLLLFSVLFWQDVTLFVSIPLQIPINCTTQYILVESFHIICRNCSLFPFFDKMWHFLSQFHFKCQLIANWKGKRFLYGEGKKKNRD